MRKAPQNVRGDGHAKRHEVAWYGCMFGFAVSDATSKEYIELTGDG